MTTETMNIREALKEKTLLDSRIEKLSNTIIPVDIYLNDSPLIRGMNPEEARTEIESNFQSLNALIMRREAINKAILNTNAVETIEVKRFVNFEKLNDDSETELISLANAINRKSYYKNIVLPMISSMLSKAQKRIFEYDKIKDRLYENIDDIIKSNKAMAANASLKNINEECEKTRERMFEARKPIILDPLNAVQYLTKAQEYVEDYIQHIDNKLSNKTELTIITITY